MMEKNHENYNLNSLLDLTASGNITIKLGYANAKIYKRDPGEGDQETGLLKLGFRVKGLGLRV